jgi:hypothetical protein
MMLMTFSLNISNIHVYVERTRCHNNQDASNVINYQTVDGVIYSMINLKHLTPLKYLQLMYTYGYVD